ncbi:ADP-ribose glycohydrolase ARH3 [Chiloscyllium plagiosum]|uniref:ADP-ribose glycohydrolase ARH3 n=1 Tax=Chiloscyllium plagiosum TaxID=36176 RepID=UPI001CB81ED8|nr:ADP-ribose glycohydrolase ARH3 [Chiloscyllium plagiosum]
MSAVSKALSPPALCRFHGAMAGALLGDCIGGEFEGKELVRLQDVIGAVRALEEHRQEEGSLMYSDDTAMTRCVAQSLIIKQDFDEIDMAKRFAEEYKEQPDRGYGNGVIRVFKKLLNPNCNDVFKPAREQFKGKGSYGNGGAMRIAPIALAYPDVQDVKKFAKKNAEVTHASSLGYNGAILQALAVHHALQGELQKDNYLDYLIGEMQLLENDEKSLSDARDFQEFPYCSRLKKMKAFLTRRDVSKEEVVNELGNGIAAFESVPTAIYSFLRCMDPDPEIPENYNGLERTIIYSISLGGDTDTIATMAGAIAGAYYGKDNIPHSWWKSCEAYKDTDYFGEKLCDLYCSRLMSSLKTG